MQTLQIRHKIITNNEFYSGMHWARRKKIADEWHGLVWAECIEQNIKPIKSYPVIITYELYVKNKNRDVDNMVATIKLINDGLRYAGILEKDTIEYLPKIEIEAYPGEEDIIYVHLQ